MADPLALPRIRGNLEKMIGAGAPVTDIDDYLASEGHTPESFRTLVKGAVAAPVVGQGGAPSLPPDPPRAPPAPMGTWLDTRMTNVIADAANFGEMVNPTTPIRQAAAQYFPETVNALSSGNLVRKGAAALGMPPVNAPGKGGKVLDAATEATIGAAFFPGSALRNVLPAAAGGAVSELAGQAAEGEWYEIPMRIFGAVVGGGAMAASQTVLGALKNALVESFRPATQAGTRSIAAKAYLGTATDPKAARAAIDKAPREIVPGSTPTTARLTNDPGLLATENVLAGTAGRGGEFALRSADNALARSTATEAIQPTGSVAAVADFFRKQIEATKGKLTATDAAAAARVQAALDGLPPGATPQQTGDAIRTALQQRVDILKTVRADASKPLYDAARSSTAKVEPTGAISTLNREGATAVGKAAGTVDAAAKYLTRADGTPKSSIAELDAAFKQLGDDIAAARAAGANNEVRILTEVRSQVERAMQGEPLYAAAKGTFEGLSRPLDKFKGPGVTSVLNRDARAGTYTMPPDVVPQQFLRQGPAGAASMREFVSTAGPNAVESMKGHIAETVRALPPMQVEGYIRRHAQALDALDPQFSAQLRGIVRAQQAAANTAKTTAAARATVDKSAPAQFLTSDPEKAVGRVLGRADARQRMAVLADDAKADPQALEGLRRGIVQDFIETTRTTATDARGNQGVSAAAVSKWWTKNKDAIRPALTRQQYENMERVVADAARDARSAPRMAGSDTARNIETGKIIQTRIAAAILGEKFANSPFGQSLMRPVGFLYRIPEERVRNALTDMALDPDLARRSLPSVNAIEQSMLRSRMNSPRNAFRTGVGAPLPGASRRDRK